MLNILFASHTPAGGPYRVGSHHLAREFRRLGHAVVHISMPTSLPHLARAADEVTRARFKLRNWAQDPQTLVWHGVPFSVVPTGLRSPALSWTADHAVSWSLLRNLRRRGVDSVDLLLLDEPRLSGVSRLMHPRLLVYRPTDVMTAPAKRHYERATLQVADAIVATSDYVLRGLPGSVHQKPTLVLENGVEFDHFAARSRLGARRGVVYVGAVDDRFDWNTVLRLAWSQPAEPFIIAGPVTNQLSGARPPNLTLTGPVDYATVPELLGTAAIGLLPFQDTAVNRGRSPMKLHEYLAAGLNVIGHGLGSAQSPPPGCYWYSSTTTAVEVLSSAMTKPVNLEGQAYAADFDWAERAGRLMDFLAPLLSVDGSSS